MDKMIAYCGLVCSECDALIATQTGDRAELEKVAAKWRIEYNAPGITAEGVVCAGCNVPGEKCFHCAECNIRACAEKKGIETCASCDEYACEKLSSLLNMVPAAKATLDALRAAL